MAHFVNHHLTDAVFVELDQLQIQANVASSRAASPSGTHVSNADFRWRNVESFEFLNDWRQNIAEDFYCLGFIPFIH